MKWIIIAAVFIGGAAGTYFRYIINFQTLFLGYPIGTIIENILGSFLLGLFAGLITYISLKEWVKAGFGAGFCGGFTTMSTLAADTFFLAGIHPVVQPLVYLSISLIGGLTFALQVSSLV